MITHPLSLVLLAFVVTAGPCLVIDETIGENLESMKVIGLSLVIGGIAMWAIDSWAGRRERAARAVVDAPPLKEKPAGADAITTAPADFEAAPVGADRSGLTWRFDDVRPMQAMVIGAAQILAAAFPGTSRSMSTIAAGQLMRLSRPAALEFSFFLAIPVMFAATGYKLLGTAMAARKGTLGYTMDAHHWGVLLVGMVVSFVVALAVIHWFMQWVRSRGFLPFAIYRLFAGAIVLWLAYR
jgi:undecaprenyl-diphosphatase